MSTYLRTAILILLGSIWAAAATCPQPGAGADILSNTSLECGVQIDTGQFSWNISNLQIVAANANVSSGGITFGFTTSDSSGVDHLSVSETIDPKKLGGWSANSTLYLAVDYTLSLTNTGTTPDVLAQTDATGTSHKHHGPKSEIEEFFNGQLTARFTDALVKPGPGKANFLVAGETIQVEDILVINAKNFGSGVFLNGFDFLLPKGDPDPGGGGGGPGDVPEPGSVALIGLGLVGVAVACRKVQGRQRTKQRLRGNQLVLVPGDDLIQDRRKVIS